MPLRDCPLSPRDCADKRIISFVIRVIFSHEDLVVTGLRSYFNTFAKSDKWHIFFKWIQSPENLELSFGTVKTDTQLKKEREKSFRQNNQAKKVESETDASHRNVHNSKSLQI